MERELTWTAAIRKVLSESNEVLTPREITESILSQNLKSTQGKTPEATVRSLLNRELRNEVHKVESNHYRLIDGSGMSPTLVSTSREQNDLSFSLETNVASDARALDVPVSWLNDVVTLLNDKRQIIFAGPPGTGKTFTALRLVDRFVRDDEQKTLIQFHPSYGYEDFFEGYKPVGTRRFSHAASEESSGDHALTVDSTDGGSIPRPDLTCGTTNFDKTPAGSSAEKKIAGGEQQSGLTLALKSGPLKKIAQLAIDNPDKPYFMIIDEINRGNLARIFGELYFLLEYRNQEANLMYSDVPFVLPDNLFIIGTMNTSDKSIALVDAAMRRRFAFVELHPDTKPTEDALSNWCSHENLSNKVALIWTELNKRLRNQGVDRDQLIGPSYFMGNAARDSRSLELVWKYEILPLIDEILIDQYESNRSIFSLKEIQSVVEDQQKIDNKESEENARVVENYEVNGLDVDSGSLSPVGSDTETRVSDANLNSSEDNEAFGN